MSDGILALAQGRGARVNACGRLVDISPESSGSVPLLRRELGAQLNVCNHQSLQLQDSAGKPIQSDNDLFQALQQGPLQAKLTATALHEIEQKKHEGRSKEHNLLSLQWQIVIEQVGAYNQVLEGFSGQLQGVKDETAKAVRSFEDAEVLRRERMEQLVKDEAAERKNSHVHIMEKIDALMAMMLAEQSAREVADYQLAKQIEQAGADLHADRNRQTQLDGEYKRQFEAVRHELEAQVQRNTDTQTRTVDSLQQIEHRMQEHGAADLSAQQRLTLLEADAEKLRIAVAHVDTAITKHHGDMHSKINRHGEEMEKFLKSGSSISSASVNAVSQQNDTKMFNVEKRVERVSCEFSKQSQDLSERAKMIEMRCAALEKDHVDRQEVSAIKSREFADKVHQAATILDTFKIEKQASEAVVQKLVSNVEDMTGRLHNAEVALDNRVSGDHWRAQLDGIAQITRKQDSKIFMLEREINARMQQEGNHRDEMRNHIQSSLKNCIDRISPTSQEPEKETPVKPTVTTRDLSTERVTVTERAATASDIRRVSPQRARVSSAYRENGFSSVTSQVRRAAPIRFDQIDANHDGVIDRAEFEAAMAAQKASPAMNTYLSQPGSVSLEVMAPMNSPTVFMSPEMQTIPLQSAAPRSLSPQPRVVYGGSCAFSPQVGSRSYPQSSPAVHLNGQ